MKKLMDISYNFLSCKSKVVISLCNQSIKRPKSPWTIVLVFFPLKGI